MINLVQTYLHPVTVSRSQRPKSQNLEASSESRPFRFYPDFSLKHPVRIFMSDGNALSTLSSWPSPSKHHCWIMSNVLFARFFPEQATHGLPPALGCTLCTTSLRIHRCIHVAKLKCTDAINISLQRVHEISSSSNYHMMIIIIMFMYAGQGQHTWCACLSIPKVTNHAYVNANKHSQSWSSQALSPTRKIAIMLIPTCLAIYVHICTCDVCTIQINMLVISTRPEVWRPPAVLSHLGTLVLW